MKFMDVYLLKYGLSSLPFRLHLLLGSWAVIGAGNHGRVFLRSNVFQFKVFNRSQSLLKNGRETRHVDSLVGSTLGQRNPRAAGRVAGSRDEMDQGWVCSGVDIGGICAGHGEITSVAFLGLASQCWACYEL